MLGRTIAATLLTAFALTGCTETVRTASPPSRAEVLWKQRTEHVGENSRVIRLTREAGFAPAGTYTISLRTAARLYAVTIALESYSLTAAQATVQLGYDVKTLGRDQQRLTAYVGTLDD
ncbi:hypothetical protein [Terrabacter terrigena]|uniref:DUF4825 domain-containing protein n=1 Tax=Terrabacter terrigena TaxID=574718 RepID=A0ABW3N384_9MICO